MLARMIVFQGWGFIYGERWKMKGLGVGDKKQGNGTIGRGYGNWSSPTHKFSSMGVDSNFLDCCTCF